MESLYSPTTSLEVAGLKIVSFFLVKSFFRIRSLISAASVFSSGFISFLEFSLLTTGSTLRTLKPLFGLTSLVFSVSNLLSSWEMVSRYLGVSFLVGSNKSAKAFLSALVIPFSSSSY